MAKAKVSALTFGLSMCGFVLRCIPIDVFHSVTVAEHHQSGDEASDHSLASSSMVMPKSSSTPRSPPSAGVNFGPPLGPLFEPSSPSTPKPATDVTDDV